MLRPIVAMLFVLLAACGPSAAPTNETPVATTAAPAPPRALDLFSDATEVRMFMNRQIVGWDDAGHFVRGTFPSRGIRLADQEVAVLRASVHETDPPTDQALCCLPRHAFVFYDRQHHVLGALRVCFECGCADVYDGPTLRRRSVRWIDWDATAVGNIVRAHGQLTDFHEAVQ
ncbi:MAG: hypothetical protein ABUS57_19315 [Pseudomonadota bacterium]